MLQFLSFNLLACLLFFSAAFGKISWFFSPLRFSFDAQIFSDTLLFLLPPLALLLNMPSEMPFPIFSNFYLSLTSIF